MTIPKLSIQLITENDLQFINQVRNDSSEFLHNNRKFNLEETVSWYLKYNPKWFIISAHIRIFRFKVFKIPIGYFRTSWVNGRFYIGMDLHKNFRGKGLCQRAYKEFIPSLYNISNQTELWLEVLKINTRAIHIYEKMGFKCVDIIGDSFLYKLEKNA